MLKTLPLMMSMLLCGLGRSIPVRAQLIPDKTLGSENSVIKPFDALNDLIDGGAKRGVNLFHSFQEFNVDAGRGVYFNNHGIENIITRVTGGNASKIFGTLGAYDNANLFLINPNGILFGPNARLALDGSFVASTASGVIFNGFEFSAVEPKEVPLLTANIPIGLRFRDNPGAIEVNNSRLEVKQGVTLGLVGGNINIDGGGLITPVGSQVELGGLTAAGVVGINKDVNGLHFSFPGGVERADMTLNNGAFVTTNDVKIVPEREYIYPPNGIPYTIVHNKIIQSLDIDSHSRMAINVRHLNLLNGSQLLANGADFQGGKSLPTADMTINAAGKVVLNQSLISNNSGGDISIKSNYLSLINGSQISSVTDITPPLLIDGIPTDIGSIDSVLRYQFVDKEVRTGNIFLQVNESISLSNSSFAIKLRTILPTLDKIIEKYGDVLPPPEPLPPDVEIPFPISGGIIANNSNSLPDENKIISDPVKFTTPLKANIAESTGNIIPAIPVNNPSSPSNLIILEGQADFGGILDTPIISADVSGGSINLKAKSLSLTDNAQISISNETTLNPKSQLGNVNVDIQDAVNITGLNSGIFLNIGKSNQVVTGNINLQAGSLTLADGAQLQTSITGSAQLEKAGDINIQLQGAGNLTNSRIASIVNEGGNNVGNLNITANSLSLNNGARLITSTEGSGNAGNIQVRTNNFLDISGTNNSGLTSGLFAGTNSTGKGGNITVETPNFRIADSAAVDARTRGQGLGGNILVKAGTFEAINGSKLTTTTLGKEPAGNINVFVTDNLKLQGNGSGIFANTAPGSTGHGGSILIDPRLVLLQNGAGIAVNSQGSGQAGDITLIAGNLTLDDQAFISAETASNQGGNINLQIQDLTFLRRGSKISSTAGTEGGPGSGGNINIGTQFLVAVPYENSDITANSFGGSGGKIDITAERVFGFQIQNQLTSQSDITAFSQLDPSLNGEIVFSTPGVDPSQGLVELPQEVINPEDQIAQNPCQPKSTNNQSEFFNLGRGGLPPNPTQAMNSDGANVRWVEPDKTANVSHTEPKNQLETVAKANQTQASIIPARGWVRNEKGEAVLVAYDTSNATPERLVAKVSACSAP
ncbi:two-partner secretion domain-containing protein [Nostoc sp.]|uniref:two-partner secretion domain-containing protein n=1 Tax=Nostoc sp. TaxID=1180 RepID=UPI002FF5D5FF